MPRTLTALLLILSLTGCSPRNEQGRKDGADDGKPDAGTKTFPVKGNDPEVALVWLTERVKPVVATRLSNNNPIAVGEAYSTSVRDLQELQGMQIEWRVRVTHITENEIHMWGPEVIISPFRYVIQFRFPEPTAMLLIDKNDRAIAATLRTRDNSVILMGTIKKIGLTIHRDWNPYTDHEPTEGTNFRFEIHLNGPKLKKITEP